MSTPTSQKLLRAILISITLVPSALLAQAVRISPSGYVAVPLSSTTQFTAAVTGLSSTAVTWSVAGSGAVNGTISATGLYTAPATAPGNPPQIIATSVATPVTKATQFVYFLTPGPTITSVSPNPIPVGTTTVTVTGTGFQDYALIDNTSGPGTPYIQNTTTFVNSTTLTCRVYFGSATTASFYVVNPGSAPSNALAIPVGTTPAKFTLTVNNGSGSGIYSAGAVVPIAAGAAPAGQAFSSWTGAAVASPASASTSITMPAANTTVTATYSPAAQSVLVVTNGSGSGTYPAGTVVPITANPAPAGQAFNSWVGATVASATSASTTVTLPAGTTVVTATYSPAAQSVLVVTNGTGSGTYPAGTVVPITANPAPAGQVFNSWVGAMVASATFASTTVTLPAGTTVVTATYSPAAQSVLVVTNGTGSGTYPAGTVVPITANPAPAGQVFNSWVGATVASATSASTTVTLPAGTTVVTATYSAAAQSVLVVTNGSGSGTYPAGTVVPITANPAPAGQVFNSWVGATVASATSASTTVTLPAGTTVVTATYSPAAQSVLVVTNGSGSGTYPAGTVVPITANPAPAGQVFNSWVGATVASATSASTTVTLPAGTTVVTATYSAPTAVTISPSGYVAIPAGATQQFTATVTGPSNTAVTWSVNGNPATYGAISPTGLYTAPAVIPPNSAEIVATSVASPGSAAVQFVSFLTPGPTLTQVSPNPLTSGETNITLSGTGFQNGAVIRQNGVQLTTTFLNSTTLTASDYFNSGTTVSFNVINPGSTSSNTLSVPVAGPAAYALTVVNGSGSGIYTAGTPVSIAAGTAPAGQVFMNWTGAAVANATASTTTLTMPAAAATVTANFGTPPPTYTLTVVNGTGSGTYPAGNIVNIDATVPGGQMFQNWTGATVANATAAATTIVMPAAAVTVTANLAPIMYVLTVVNGTPSGSYAPGSVIALAANAPPAGEYFQAWSGPGIANTNQPTTTIVMPAANTTVSAGYNAPAPVPFPISAHPRLWMTPADVTKYRNWATSGNAMYRDYQNLVNQAVSNYQGAFPGAALSARNPTAANPYPDLGDVQGYQGMLSESIAMILAFQSVIDPSATNQQNYAQAARNLIMYAMNLAALGHSKGQPFRDPAFMVYNRASATGHEWSLAIDWIYNATDAMGNPILTAADKATIQQVFLMWSADCVNADTTGGDSPQVHGVLNNLQLLPGNLPYRMASNNYYLAHARILTMMGLTLDPADDPPVNAQVAPSAVGNTERSYILESTGAWLYQIYAMMGEPAAVAQAYGIPNNPTGAGFGLASGGLPPEGMLYGESFGYVLGQLLALQTAGFNDPELSGPQIALIGSPVWDRYVTGFLSSLTPTSFIPQTESYLGPVYTIAGYGDMLRNYVSPDFIRPIGLLALLEGENGQTTHLDTARWFAVNVLMGGPDQLTYRVEQPWTWEVTNSLLYFMLFDPAAPAGSDPRPTYPTLFYDAPAARVLAHSDWTPNGTLFDYRASWININHQDGDGGFFELYRHGEWLTKRMNNYDDGGNGNGATTEWLNSLSLENWCARGLPLYISGGDSIEWNNGSQWMENEDAGDPTTVMSNGTASGVSYVYAASNLTNLYNRPDVWSSIDNAVDVTQATRSILWMNNLAASDFIVIYDRATTVHTGLFKRFNMSLVTSPTISGNTAAELMPDGQELYVQTLLPLNPSISQFNGAAMLSQIADLEPTQWILQVQDTTNPADTRFLHVLQGANPNTQMAPATYLQSSSGTPFDGAEFANVAVFFPAGATTPFTGTTFVTPLGVNTVLVTGLTPGAGYNVTLTPSVITVTPGGSAMADAAGVLVIAM